MASGTVLVSCTAGEPVLEAARHEYDYPTTSGTQWTYRVTVRSPGRQLDTTVTVNAHGLTHYDYLPTEAFLFTLSRFNFRFAWLPDSVFVAIDTMLHGGDSTVRLRLYWPRSISRPIRELRLPFYVDSLWYTDRSQYESNDRVGVVQTDTVEVTTPMRRFDSVQVIRLRYSCGDECQVLDVFYLTPDYGVVRRVRKSIDWMSGRFAFPGRDWRTWEPSDDDYDWVIWDLVEFVLGEESS